jgi:hypothetical protein
MFILDTDTLSLLHAGNKRLQESKNRFAPDQVATTVITRIEVLRGRFDFALKAKDGSLHRERGCRRWPFGIRKRFGNGGHVDLHARPQVRVFLGEIAFRQELLIENVGHRAGPVDVKRFPMAARGQRGVKMVE